MTLQELINQGGTIAELAKGFVLASAAFLEELSKNNLNLDFGPADNTSNVIDYDSPASSSYVKTYKPISAADIAEASRKMSEAISGEKFMEGFIACVQLLLMARP